MNCLSQIASQWSGVSSVHVDDFLGCGTDQMLIFKNNKEGHPLESFLITDLCGISYSVSHILSYFYTKPKFNLHN